MKGYKETLAEGKSPPPFPLLKDSGRIYHHASAGREKKKNPIREIHEKEQCSVQQSRAASIKSTHYQPVYLFPLFVRLLLSYYITNRLTC